VAASGITDHGNNVAAQPLSHGWHFL